jgi:hypothetical protein
MQIRALGAAWVVWASMAAAALGQATRQADFEEQFALAADRRALLAQLIPGSEDAYYYSALERQQAGDFAAAAELLRTWAERHGQGERWQRAKARQMLLAYKQDPAATWQWLTEITGARFDAQPELPGVKADVPTALDPQAVSAAAWRRRALELHPGTAEGLKWAALDALAQDELSDELLASVMPRLRHADFSRASELVVRHLALRTSGGFGSIALHGELTLAQLEDCAKREPKLLGDERFVAAWLARLAPGGMEDAERDRDVQRAHLERLESFVGRLSGAFNSLKAHVLYHRLALDLASGTPDRARFERYLRLPRPSPTVQPRRLEDALRVREQVVFGASFATGLPSVREDEALVRAYLEAFTVDAEDTRSFAELVEPRYLARVFAETKILAGKGDMERWYSLLDDPEYYEQLKQRVELRFAPTQREYYGADEPVTLEVDVKNVPTLLVKVFEVHALNWYTAQGKEIDAGIDLDGLVANEERTFEYGEPSLRRVRRKFELPALRDVGTYVVEFIGNGTASRALIRKGTLKLVERSGAAGQELIVLDERGVVQEKAAVHVDGRRYGADAQGRVRVPFTSSEATKNVVLESGTRAALASFRHRKEAYSLRGTALVEREELRSGERAKLVIRPWLLLQGEPVKLEVLEEPVLTVRTTDADGTPVSVDVRGLELRDDRELVHEITVPQRLQTLEVTLSGEVKQLSNGEKLRLSETLFSGKFSEILRTQHIGSPLLGRDSEGWFLDVLGRSGEALAGSVLSIELRHRDYEDSYSLELRTDAAGRVRLGELAGVEWMSCSGFDGVRGWTLTPLRPSQPGRLHGVAGDTLRVVHGSATSRMGREVATLLLTNAAGAAVRDESSRLALAGEYLELRGLAAGTYRLELKELRDSIELVIAEGVASQGWVAAKTRVLELSPSMPLAIQSIALDGADVVVTLSGATEAARVHVFATRYMPSLGRYGFWRPVARDLQDVELGAIQSDLRAGRELSDEYRYILERRFAKKFPGNMLARPSLLLNPWSLEESDTLLATGGGSGSSFGGRAGGRRDSKARGGAAAGGGGAWGSEASVFSNLDFLAGSRGKALNLTVDRSGVVRVPRAALGDGQWIHAIALQGEEQAQHSLATASVPLNVRDQRLAQALDGERHVSERRTIDVVRAGEALRFDAASTDAVQLYDTLESVFRFFRTSSGDAELERFSFLTRWPNLSAEEKRARYSQHACHEVHFFLYRKDPKFFAEVVRPYLANKLEKEFFDRWLLGEDLAEFATPQRISQLNVVELALLLQRLPERSKSGVRSVRDAVELLPVDVESEEQAFSTVLAGDSLAEGSDAFFLGRAGKPMAPGAPASPGPAPSRAPESAAAGEQGGLKGAELRAEAEKSKADFDDAPLKDAEVPEESNDGVAQDKLLRGLGYVGGGGGGLGGLEERRKTQQLYVPVRETQRLAESQYWKVPQGSRTSDLVSPSRFWLDYMEAPSGTTFLSTHFTLATRSVTEMLLALAVLDLPFEAGEQQRETQGDQRELKSTTAFLAVRRELRASEKAADSAPLLVSQNYFRHDDRFDDSGSQRVDKFVRGEYLVNVAYGVRVVVTNPTSAQRPIELLLQVPAGSVPLGGARATRGQRLILAPYATQAIESTFYFPRAGKFAHYPVHVSEGEALVAYADATTLEVLAEPKSVDTTSWSYLSQRGTLDETLAFLRESNLQRVNLERIAWRMRDRKAYDAVLGVLRDRLRFDSCLWIYALLHRDEAAAREYLESGALGAWRVGLWLESSLASFDPWLERAYEHIEFDPLVHPRVHPFGRVREVRNREVEAQWRALLSILSLKPKPSAEDWMAVTYHLFLQDRTEEALAAFANVDADSVRQVLQLDYLRAYAAFYSENPESARAIAERYRDYGVERWRLRFGEVLAQLDEAAGKGQRSGESSERDTRQAALAAAESALELSIEGARMSLAHANLESCEVSYFPMDIEFLFSTNPFVGQDSREFAFIRPRRSEVVALAADARTTTIEVPAELRGMNLLIEVRAGSIVRRKPCLQGTLRAQFLERSGQVSVTDSASGLALSKVYVKVYAKLANGQVRFHKDGYTDLRGRFDYASMSGEGANDATRYAVLVSSENAGAHIAEIAPPAR